MERGLFNLHHIVSDGWSIGVLIREIAALYPAFRAGRPSPLPELPLQYADFAVWQRGFLSGGPALEAQLGYWRQQLQGAPALSQLPTDRPRPAVQRYHGRRATQELPEAAVAALRRLCQEKGSTLFMGLLAVYAALLARESGSLDLTIGTPVAGRNRAELEGLIGLFINSLVLRLRLPGDPGLGEILDQAREVALGAFAHQDLPFAKLVAEVSPDRNLGSTPLFQVQLLLVEAEFGALSVPDLTLTPGALEESTSKLDLTLRARAQARGMTLQWLYNSDLFDAATILRLGAHFATLLPAAAGEPGRALSTLPLLAAGEQHQLLFEWNDATVAGWLAPEPGTLHGIIAAQAARTPDRTAVSYEDEALTYGELLASARRLARRLRDLGVGPDVTVGVFAERSLEMVVGLLAILEAGGAYLPLDPAYPADRLAYMIADAAAPVILAQERLLERLPEHGAEVIPLDGTIVHDAAPEPALTGGADPSDLAYVIYTSGSTGRPKGTMNSHRGIVNRLLWMQAQYGLTPADRVLQKTPFSFDVSVWEFFWPLMTGARLVMARPGGHQDPAYLVETIAAEGITTLHFVPSMLRVFVDDAGDRGLRVAAPGDGERRGAAARAGEAVPRPSRGGAAQPLRPDRGGGGRHVLVLRAGRRPRRRADRPADGQHPHRGARPRRRPDPSGRARGAAHRRRPARPRLSEAAGPDGRALRARPAGGALGGSWGAALPHRRPRPYAARRRRGVPGPPRPPGEAARPAHRAGRDRGGAVRAGRCARDGGDGEVGRRRGAPGGVSGRQY